MKAIGKKSKELRDRAGKQLKTPGAKRRAAEAEREIAARAAEDQRRVDEDQRLRDLDAALVTRGQAQDAVADLQRATDTAQDATRKRQADEDKRLKEENERLEKMAERVNRDSATQTMQRLGFAREAEAQRVANEAERQALADEAERLRAVNAAAVAERQRYNRAVRHLRRVNDAAVAERQRLDRETERLRGVNDAAVAYRQRLDDEAERLEGVNEAAFAERQRLDVEAERQRGENQVLADERQRVQRLADATENQRVANDNERQELAKEAERLAKEAERLRLAKEAAAKEAADKKAADKKAADKKAADKKAADKKAADAFKIVGTTQSSQEPPPFEQFQYPSSHKSSRDLLFGSPSNLPVDLKISKPKLGFIGRMRRADEAARKQRSQMKEKADKEDNEDKEDTPTTFEELKPHLETDYSLLDGNNPTRSELQKRPPKNDLGPDRLDEEEILDADYLSDGWDYREPDLDPEDYDAQIERCDERIRKRKMNWLFESRKRRLTEKKQIRDDAMKEYPDLDWDVVQRIRELETMRKSMKEEDDSASLENVDAIIEAYENKNLSWHPHLVTYWAKGVQRCKPRPFDWNEFELIHDEFDGYSGFWVEAFQGHSGATSFASDISHHVAGIGNYLFPIDVSLRLDSTRFPLSFQFVDDTGASVMSLFHGDIEKLRHFSKRDDEKNPPPGPRNIGRINTTLANGYQVNCPVVAVRPNIIADNSWRWLAGNAFSDWPRVPCMIFPDVSLARGARRLLGPWLRTYLYTATAPSGTYEMWVSNARSELGKVLPTINLDTFKPNPPIPGSLRATITFPKSP